MSKRKHDKKTSDINLTYEGFDDICAESIEIERRELTKHKRRVEKQVGDTKRDVEQKREEIRRGGQRKLSKRFRL